MLELPSKGIFYDNQVCADGPFYDNKPRKLGGKQRLLTTDGRQSRMFISDGLAYLPVRFPTDEDIYLYPKVPLTPAVGQNPQDLDDNGQWDESDNDASFGTNVSATIYTRSDYFRGSILSEPEHKALSVTFSDDMAFTKGATDD